MTKSHCLLILLLFTATLSLSAQSPAKHKLLWEISGNELQTPSYLFGTMHVADSRVYNLPDSVFLAIQNSEGFALEIDFDTMSYSTFSYLYESQNGSTWGDVLNPEEEDTKSHKSSSDSRLLLDLFKLGANDHPQEAASLDAFLYRLAKEYKKEITGLESIEEQLNLIADPESGLEDAEIETKPGQPRRRLTLNRMIEIYENGDLDLLDEYVNKPNPKGHFEQNVIIARNYVMAERADSLIKIRSTFLGVGAAHLPGDEGVIALLAARGYKLRPVKATYTGLNKEVRKPPYQPQWQTFRRESEGYQIKVPTRPYSAKQGDGDHLINIGMDLPGGIVFTFYAFPTDPTMSKYSIGKKFDKLERSMRNKAYRVLESEETTYKGFPAREIMGKKGNEYFRAKMVIARGFLYSMFWNGSKKVVESPLTDEWFSSLEFFTPLPLSQQTLRVFNDQQWRYKINFPIENSTTNWSSNTFAEGGNNGFYTTMSANDSKHGQNITIHVEDYSGHFQRGNLTDRMADCIYFFADESLSPIGDFTQVSNGGIDGLEGKYIDSDGMHYTTRCFLEANRLFFIGMKMEPNEADSARLKSIFDSFELTAFDAPPLKHEFECDNYHLKFPQAPYTWTETENIWLSALDTINIAWSHDDASSLNFISSSGHISKYYSGTADDLFDATKDYAIADSQIVIQSSKHELNGLPAMKMLTRNEDSTLLDAYLVVVAGEQYLELDAQVPNTSKGKVLAETFLNGLKVENTGPQIQLGQGKLPLILAGFESDGIAQAEAALEALYNYRFLENEYPLAIETVLEYDQDSSNQKIAKAIVYALVESGDSVSFQHVKKLASLLQPNSANKMALIIKLLGEDDYYNWALSELEKVAKQDLPIPNSGYSWQNYLEEDAGSAKIDPLLFLFQSKELGLRLAYDCIVIGEEQPTAYAKYFPQIREALDISLANFNPVETEWLSKLMISYVLEALAYSNTLDWEKSARAMMKKPKSYIASDGAIALLDNNRPVRKADIVAVCENRYARYFLIEWAFTNFRTDVIPKKYLKTDFLALLALEAELPNYPSKIELLEKRKVFVEGYQQLLYIYRFSNPDESEWRLGFSGPFPMKGMPDDIKDLSLTGEAEESYHPVRLEKQVKKWLRAKL